MTKKKKIIVIIIGIAGLLAILGTVFALNSEQILRTLGVTKPAPVFSYKDTKAPGWWATDNYNSQESVNRDEYKGSEPIDELPVASVNVFKGKKGQYATACFVMFSYYDYKTDTAKLLEEKNREVAASDSMKKIGNETLSINAVGETKSFTLAQYELIGPDAENSMKGMSYGWVDLGDGYMSVSGVCPTAAELGDTVDAISAISLVRQ